jgi:hypothetical protein
VTAMGPNSRRKNSKSESLAPGGSNDSTLGTLLGTAHRLIFFRSSNPQSVALSWPAKETCHGSFNRLPGSLLEMRIPFEHRIPAFPGEVRGTADPSASPDFLSRIAASISCMWFSLKRTT